MHFGCHIFIIILLVSCTPCKCKKKTEDPGVFEKIRSGLQMAGQMLGLDRASAIARLVSETFGKKNGAEKEQETAGGAMFGGFFRLLGLDGSKMGALAINTIIFLAQLLSSSLLPEGLQNSSANEPRSTENPPLDWILDTSSRGAAGLLNTATDKSLPDKIIDLITTSTNQEDIRCIKLLVCKSAPFVWKMQTAIKNRQEKNKPNTRKKYDPPVGALFQYLPTLQEFEKQSEECEQVHGICE